MQESRATQSYNSLNFPVLNIGCTTVYKKWKEKTGVMPPTVEIIRIKLSTQQKFLFLVNSKGE